MIFTTDNTQTYGTPIRVRHTSRWTRLMVQVDEAWDLIPGFYLPTYIDNQNYRIKILDSSSYTKTYTMTTSTNTSGIVYY